MSPTITDPLGDALRRVEKAFVSAAKALYPQSEPRVVFESPRRPEFGDFATNVAFTLAKAARKSPQDIATAILERARALDAPALDSTLADAQAAGGFINVRIAPDRWQRAIAGILQGADAYGSAPRRDVRISLEFGSANPTGPLVVVQGRSTSIGSTLANTMRFRGYDVVTEWIINDAGSQMETLGRSLYARYRQTWEPDFPFPENGYPGDYLEPLARSVVERDGERWRDAAEADWLPFFARFGRDRLVAEQRATCERFGVQLDRWQSELELHESGAVERGLAALRERGLTYEKDGALWCRAKEFGDDEDRVLVRSDGRPTYFAVDVAYHYDKFERGAQRVIDLLGPDHHGYIKRLQAIAASFGRAGAIEVFIAQQITLMRGSEQVSMSKRAGHILTLDEIIDEVGTDVARFFFVMLSPDQPLTFDLVLAKEHSESNPVYYVQYAHMRIASVLRKTSRELRDSAEAGAALAGLTHPSELALARRLAEFPALLESVVAWLAPHRLTRYAQDVASDFHQFYSDCRILTEDKSLSSARLSLAVATKIVLANILRLLGVSAPTEM